MFDILLVANGVLPCKKVINDLKLKSKQLICLDGAYNKLKMLSIETDIILGDLDSISEIPDSVQIIHTLDQNLSDLEKCFMWCIEKGIENIAICGILGGRLDHMLINLGLSAKYAQHLNIHYFDDESEAFILQVGKHTIRGIESQLFSILAIESVQNLSIIGSNFDLSEFDISLSSRGLSNSFKQDNVTISFTNGTLLFILIK